MSLNGLLSCTLGRTANVLSGLMTNQYLTSRHPLFRHFCYSDFIYCVNTGQVIEPTVISRAHPSRLNTLVLVHYVSIMYLVYYWRLRLSLTLRTHYNCNGFLITFRVGGLFIVHTNKTRKTQSLLMLHLLKKTRYKGMVSYPGNISQR